MNYILDLCISLLGYALLFLSLFGWGLIITSCLTLKLPKDEQLFSNVWLGFSGVLLITQIVHLFFPISVFISLPLLSIGICSSFVMFIKKPIGVKQIIAQWRSLRLYIVIIGLCLIWFASRSMLTPTIFDSGLYHFNSIRWLNEYPIVFGLGNLHGRLAFNQTFFVWVALLNIFPYFNHGYNLANAFFIGLVFSEGLYFGGRFTLTGSKPEIWSLSSLFSFFSILIVFLRSYFSISSPSPDIFIILVQTILMLHLFRLIERDKEPDLRISELKFILIIATCSATCKLSTAIYSLLIVLSAFTITSLSAKSVLKLLRRIVSSLVLSLLILCVWWGRGIVQSGAPMFPSTFLWVDTGWSVPLKRINIEAKHVYAYARQPQRHWDDVLSSWEWLPFWFKMASRNKEMGFTLKLFLLGGVGMLIVRAVHLKTRQQYRGYLASLIGYIPLLGALVFWFFTAPNFRFATGIFWLLAILPVVHTCAWLRSEKIRMIWIGICLVVLIEPFWFYGKKALQEISFTGYQPIITAKLTQRTTKSGLIVFMPVKSEFQKSWDSPLPATPYFNPSLCLRGDSLKDGFSVKGCR